MSEAFPSLPPGMQKLCGGIARDKGTLCWDDSQAAAWSPDSGWTVLQDRADQISMAFATEQGIVALSTANELASFWAWGSEDWSWSAPVAGLADCAMIAIAGSYVVTADAPRMGADFLPLYQTRFRIWLVSPDGLQQIAEFDADGSFNLACAAIDHPSGDLIIACSEGLFRFRRLAAGFTLEKITDCSLYSGPFTGPAISRANRAVVFPTEGPALGIDMKNGRESILAIGDIYGCQALWRALIADELDRIPLILEALKHVPRSPSISEWDLFDLTVLDDLTAVVVGPQGITRLNVGWRCSSCGVVSVASRSGCSSCGATAPPDFSPSEPSMSVADYRSVEVLTWRLKVEPEQALPEAIDELLEGCMVKPELLALSVAEAAGDRAGVMMLEHARRRNPAPWCFGFLEGVREVFRHFGTHNAEPVSEALVDADPAVVSIALVASGTVQGKHPALWDAEHQIPIERIRPLLGHEHDTVAALAADACAALGLSDCDSDVGALLDRPHSVVRRKAIESLGRLPDLDWGWRDRIADLMVTDPYTEVRDAAIEVTAELRRPEKYLDRFIDALGDISYEPRSSACRVLSMNALATSADQFFRIVDTLMLLLMASNVGDRLGHFASGVGGLLNGTAEKLVQAIQSGSPPGSEPVDPEVAAKLTFTVLVALFAAPLDRSGCALDGGGFEELRSVFESIDRDPLITDAEYAVLKDSNDGVPPLVLLQRVEAQSHHRLAHRLAVLALFCRRRDVGRHFVETTGASTDAYVPLHIRLRRADSSSDSFALCKELVVSESKRIGLAWLPALYCLAATGDSEATRELADKILAGDCHALGVVPSAILQLFEAARKRVFMERLLLADPIPMWHRLQYFQGWDLEADGELTDSVERQFLRSCSASAELGSEARLEAARLLADRGEPEALERQWAGIDPAELTRNRLYDYSKDMARAGHAAYLENVRGTWIDRGDMETLKAFAAAGTEGDLGELEIALEQNAPEQMIRDTMDAIRARRAGNR